MTPTISTQKDPVALLPVLMSAAAIAIVLIHLTFVGAAPQTDEGAEAHLWQLLMAGQIPIVVFLALTRLARNPQWAIRVLAVQAVAALAALAPVYLMHW